MYENNKATMWVLLCVVAIAIESVDMVLQTQKYTVEKNRDIPSKENSIGNVSAKSRLHCASWCMSKNDCCSSVYDKQTGTCGLYACCSLNTTAALYQDVLIKQPKQDSECNGLTERCPISQGYRYQAELCLCLKYNATKVLHHVAVAECAADCGQLVQIDSLTQQQNVESFLANSPDETSDFVWIQGDKSTGVYILDNGTEMSYFNWDVYEPSYPSNTNEPYLMIKISAQYRWHDAPNTWTSSGTLCQVF